MNDFLNDKRTRHWHQLAEQGGTRAGASFPLLKKNRAIGVLLFLASERGVFTQDLVDLLGRLAENISFALANFDQADERLNADKQIHYLATHDGLTGLPNRLMFGQLLDRSAKTASRYNLKFAILFIDLDRFKLVNDSLGHAAGDELLKQVATRLVHSVRESDVVARLGGDEFVVLLQQIGDSEQAETIARKLLTALCPAITVMGHECRATASIGISLYPGDGEDADTLMKNADIAMYAAKDAGKNDVRLFSPHIKSHSVERFSLEADLRHALERNQFYLHYQPKLAVASGTLNGVEALIRWSHPDFGDLAPMTFIPLAEESGLIVPIGRWVLRTACAQNMAWQQQGLPPISVAVNLSPRQFLDDDLLQDIDEALGATSMPAHLLQLEITEGMVIQHVERAKALLTAIRCRGVRLAIDDFGIGYSSLSVMKQFPIDIIKIDRSFVQDLAASAQDRAIATAIINMGRALGVTVVAEGIETVEQDRFLRESLCDELQGFLFSKPLPPNDIAILLRTCASGLPSELAAVSPP